MRLLRAGTERGLLAGRLEAVGLEDTLEGLGGGTLAGATATGGHGRGGGVSSGRDTVHFVLRLRQTFRLNATSKKWSLLLLEHFLRLSLLQGGLDIFVGRMLFSVRWECQNHPLAKV